ncbi:MAG TPA: efflux RND transporter periplasmic adaptor subunit [Anaerolineaceae bacterium]
MANRVAGKRKAPRRLWIALIAVVILAGGGAAAAYLLGLISTSSAQAATARTVEVRKGVLRQTITGAGTYAAGETANLSFSENGVVSTLNAALGEAVTRGQVLATIGDTQELEAAVSAAQVKLLKAQTALKQLQGSANVTLAQAYADLVAAQSAYTDAADAAQRTAYARCSEDVNLRYAAALKRAQENLAKQAKGSAAYANAQNDLDTATANYNYCIGYTDSEKITAQASLDLAKQKLDKAQQQYDLLKATSGIDPDDLRLAEAQVDEAQKLLDQAKENLTGATLIAPISGTVTYLAADAGVRVNSDQTFLTISDLSQPVMDVTVDETDLTSFVVGNKATVVFDSLPDQSFTGTLVEVLPQLQNSFMSSVLTGTIALDANDALKSLPIGLNATVTIIAAEAPDALMVPLEALHARPDGTYSVTVVASSGAQEQRAVELGLQDSTMAQIVSGLSEGEQVVISIDSSSLTGQSETTDQGGMMIPGGMPPGGGAGGIPSIGGGGMP